MVKGTQLLSPSLPGFLGPVDFPKGTTELLVERGTVLDVAVGQALKGEPRLWHAGR